MNTFRIIVMLAMGVQAVPAFQASSAAPGAAPAAAPAACKPQRIAKKTSLTYPGGRTVLVDIVDTPQSREIGLMCRTKLAPNYGMLFVFPREMALNFWMKNTRIPLSIAFIDAHGKIIQIERMQPYDFITQHPSQFPSQYALEVNKGWFERNGVGVGDTMEIPHSGKE